MGSLETDDLLTIVNRTTEYRISKKLIRKIPYFDVMLSHDSLEARENKAVLDFDEKALELILNRIKHDYIFINIYNLINVATIADYFGMQDLMEYCKNHFDEKFTILHLPTVIGQVTPTSSLLNSGALNAFICRHFLKIANSPIWLYYPLETIEYICKLDLKIRSERQVFDVIMKWVIDDPERESHLERLLSLVRWCHMEPKHLADIDKNSLVNPGHFGLESFCTHDVTHCRCACNRTEQKYLVIIEKLNTNELRIKVLDNKFYVSFSRVVKLDESMPLNVLHDEHVSDIVLDSGRRMIRIDWQQAKYRLLDFEAFKMYYLQTGKYIVLKPTNICKQYACASFIGCSLLESDDDFISLNSENGNAICRLDPTVDSLNSKCAKNPEQYNYWAIILNRTICIFNNNFDFITCNLDKNGDRKIVKITDGWNFNDLLLTSYEDRIILLDKSSKKLFSFNVNTRKWSSIGLLINYNCKDCEKEPELLTFTSAYLSNDAIGPFLRRELDS